MEEELSDGDEREIGVMRMREKRERERDGMTIRQGSGLLHAKKCIPKRGQYEQPRRVLSEQKGAW